MSLSKPPGEALHLGGVVTDGANEAGELGLYLGHVGGHLRHAAGENVEIVVAVELELLEIVDEGARVRLRGRRPRPAARPAGGRHGGQLRVAVLTLEGLHRLRHARAAPEEELAHPVELREVVVHA